ncbi:MAG: peptidylprolyl isomerase [Gammaproteobacteria bacterium]|nr:peptidylprolyl isomerase [Gammaproteobacteria bacterium]
MKNKIGGAVLLLLSPVAFAADADVVVTVNGQPVTQADLERYSAERPGAPREQLLDELVARELIYQDALKRGLDKDAEVKREIAEMRERVLMAAAVRQAVEQKPVTEDELKAEYDKVKAQLARDEFKARHILVADEAQARQIIAELDKGAEFAELARKHSTGPTNKTGGDLGWFSAEQMVPPFADAVRKLKKGSYTKAPVQTQFGWHVIKLEDTRSVPAPSFAEVKERLHAALQQQRVAEYVQNLRKGAKVDPAQP